MARLGEYRAQLREKAGLSKLELAVKANVGLSTVLRCEQGCPMLDVKLRAIATALGVPVGKFMDGP